MIQVISTSQEVIFCVKLIPIIQTMTSQISSTTKPLQIGVMLEAIQLSDIIAIDIIGSVSKSYILASEKIAPLPPVLHEQAREMTFHYIASSLTEPAFMTPSLYFKPTVTYDTCPHDLDILIIGGPLPDHRPVAATKFLKETVIKTDVVMTICTGGMWLAHSGVLDGKKATTNRGVLSLAKAAHPEVEWKDERWVVDGKFWTAGGAGCGIDMAVEFVKQNFGKEIVEYVLQGLQFGVGKSKGRFYED
jgi:transcriptional regulator GlxA family with amidase domain